MLFGTAHNVAYLRSCDRPIERHKFLQPNLESKMPSLMHYSIVHTEQFYLVQNRRELQYVKYNILYRFIEGRFIGGHMKSGHHTGITLFYSIL